MAGCFTRRCWSRFCGTCAISPNRCGIGSFWFNRNDIYAGFVMIAGLVGLLARRIVVDRVRYISSPSDHLFLLLLLGIGGSGLFMKYVAHTYIVALKACTLGLILFDWQPLPADPILLTHLSLVAALMIVFPFSKLLHAPGLFFNPTRYQVDNARERRYVARRRAT